MGILAVTETSVFSGGTVSDPVHDSSTLSVIWVAGRGQFSLSGGEQSESMWLAACLAQEVQGTFCQCMICRCHLSLRFPCQGPARGWHGPHT